MRADALGCERWQGFGRLFDRATNKTVDAESRERLLESVKEDKILGATPSHQWFENVRSARPNGAVARLIAFAYQAHRGRTTPSNSAHAQMGSLVSARSGVVEEQQQSVIAPALGHTWIGGL